MSSLRQWDGTQWLEVTDEQHRNDASDVHPQYVLKTDNTVDNLLDADTTTTAPAAGNVLTWAAPNWVPAPPAAVGMNDLTDADTVTLIPTPGDGLIWDGTNWIPGASVSQGITPLVPVRVASNATGVIASPPAAIDGITMVAGDRVLVKNQTNAVENGIYIYGATLTRAADANTEGSLIPGNSVLVQEGIVNGGVSFLVALESVDLPWTPGTDEDRWYAAISKLDMQAGAGLSITGKVLNVGQGQGILVGADDVALDTTFTDGRYSLAAHAHTLDSLTDADTSTVPPAVGDGLQWDGTNWIPAAPAAGATLPVAGAGLTGGVASYDVGAGAGIVVAADTVAVDRTVTDTWYPPTTTAVTAGAGLTGGGTLAAPVVLDVGAGTGITVAVDTVSLDKAYTDGLYSPLAHVHALDDLSDADTTTTPPVANNVLTFNGSVWAPAVPAAGGVDELKELLDVDVLTTPPVDRDSLIYNLASSKWVPGTVSSGGVTDHAALTGLAGDDHLQYTTWAISNTVPAAPRAGAFWLVIP